MIIVTGATGQLGALVVDKLLDRVPAGRVGVSVRDPGRAAHLAARGVRVRRGDFADPGSLADAFEGATQVLIVSADKIGEEAVALHVAAIDAARAAGAERVLYTSHQAAAEDSLFAPMPDHAATEQHLAKTGRYTALRNGFYASTVGRLLGNAAETGELSVPADGPVSWTTHADLAEAAAIILAGEAVFEGPTPPLTASVALDLTQITTPGVRRVVADDEEWVGRLTGHGVPADQAAMLLGMFRAARRGEFAVTDPTLTRLLGRPTQPVRTS